MGNKKKRVFNIYVILLVTCLSCGGVTPIESLQSSSSLLTDPTISEVYQTLAATTERLLESQNNPIYSHSGTVENRTLTTGGTGRVLGRTSFQPHGEIRRLVGNLGEYGFTGQELDQSVGLHNFKFRYLDTHSGRWVSPDPLFKIANPDGLKQFGEATTSYTYARGRLITGYDQSGLLFIVEDANRDKRTKNAARMGRSIDGAPPQHTVVTPQAVRTGLLRKGRRAFRTQDVREVAFLSHTSGGATTMKFPLGDPTRLKTASQSADLAYAAFSGASTMVLMGCYTAKQGSGGGAAGTFLEQFAARVNALEQTAARTAGRTPKTINVIGATGAVTAASKGPTRAVGKQIFQATGGAQRAIPRGSEASKTKNVFKNRRKRR